MFEQINSQKASYILDGKNSGMAAWIISEGKFLENSGNYLFANFQILESTLIAKGYTPLDYIIHFIVNDNNSGTIKCSINSSLMNPKTGLWECYPYEVNGLQGHYYQKVFIKETYIDNVSCIGYIQTNESDAEFSDKKQIYKKQKKILDIVKAIVADLTAYPYYSIYIKDDQYENFCVNLLGSTAKIHICTNQFVMNFNDKRRKATLRCLPFVKGKNKYGTLYVFVTVDENEREEIKNRAYYLIDVIIENIKQNYPELDVQFEDVIFKGYIEIKREEE